MLNTWKIPLLGVRVCWCLTSPLRYTHTHTHWYHYEDIPYA